MSKNFDLVELKSDTGDCLRLNWEEFWKLPLLERIQALSKGHLKFFLEGRPVDPVTAVRRMDPAVAVRR